MSSVETTPETKKRRGRPRKDLQTIAAASDITEAPIGAPPPAELSDTGQIIRAITTLSRDPQLNIQNMQFLLEQRRALMMEEAEQGYNDAMARAQAKMRPIAKDCENPQTRSRYASYTALDNAIRPIYSGEGFALTFDTDVAPNPNDILVVADVTHGRFTKRYKIPMPCDGKGPRGNDVMTRTHAVGSATTYGRRYLLGMIFNIVTGQDDDGNRAGGHRQQPAAYRQPIAPDRPPAPPPPQENERARHTRQAVAAATTHARNQLLQKQLEASVAVSGNDQRAEMIGELRGLLEKAKVSDATVCEAFNVETLEDLTGEQVAHAIRRAKKTLKDAGVEL